jgi:hypothetical protein
MCSAGELIKIKRGEKRKEREIFLLLHEGKRDKREAEGRGKI